MRSRFPVRCSCPDLRYGMFIICQCAQINYSHFLCYFHLKRRNQHPVFIIFTRQFFHQIRSVRKRSSCIIRSSFPKPDPIFTCLPLIRVDGMWIPVRTGRSLPVFIRQDHMALPSCLRCDPKWDIRQSFQSFICRFHQL